MAPLPDWFRSLCALGADRFDVLTRALTELHIAFDVVETGPFRHVQARGVLPLKPRSGEKLLLAHYDRVDGTPGANDNGASVLALVEYAAQRRAQTPRIVFTDGEELSGQFAADQGSFALARGWDRGLLPLVLDMTGIGDTVILGHLAEHLVKQSRGTAPPAEASAKVRRAARRFLAQCGGVEINTPFSDDLGLLLAGVPSMQISVLPRGEAEEYKLRRKAPGELSGEPAGALPPSWRAMHTADDRPETLWPESRRLIAGVLETFERFPWRP